MKIIKRAVQLSILMAFSTGAMAQSNVISNNKSLAFLNPALQNAEYNQFYLSTSLLPNPLSEESNFNSYLLHAESKLGNQFRIGFHSSSVETRLNKFEMNKLYSSFQFEFEEGDFFSIGLEAGLQKDQAKVAEFNKVFSPTVHSYTDSVAQDFDLGFGLSYVSRGLTVGISINKLNSPNSVPYPVQRWAFGEGADSNSVVKKDTNIVYDQDDFFNGNIQANINISYKWEVNKNINLIHFLHISNPSSDGADFIGFQNFAEFGEKLSIGLGLYHNGETSFMGSAAYAFSKNIRLEVAAFLHEEFNYDPNAPFPFTTLGNYPIKAMGAYQSAGFVPSFEANLQLSL